MSPSSTFTSDVQITFIGTATAIIEIDGVNFLTDPAFDPVGSEYPLLPGFVLRNAVGSVLAVDQLPKLDAILLGHEDHPDNLDERGRALLSGHKVFVTADGANKLKHLEDVTGFKPWDSVIADIGGKEYKITATPCVHFVGECVGFILENEAFGIDQATGLPNAIWFSGDTINHPELQTIKEKWHIVIGIFNLGDAHPPGGPQVTMGGHDCAELSRSLGVDIIVPMHFEGWNHFQENGPQLKAAFEKENVSDSVSWLRLGEPVRVA